MSGIIDANREELHTKLINLANEHLPSEQAELVAKFIHQYYATVAIEDLLCHDLMDLYGAVISHWNLFYQRKPEENKLRLYNPQFEQHGWQSTHTILEIVHDDMPFMVDSLQMELNRCGLTSHMIIHVGGLKVKRDKDGKVVDIFPPRSKNKDVNSEALIFFELDRQTDPKFLEDLETSCNLILEDVRYAVQDWKKILAKVDVSLNELEKNPPPVSEEEIKETKDFLHWIADNHFTFIGYREYELDQDGEGKALRGLPETGLGVLRETPDKKGYRSFAKMTSEARKLALSKQPLIIAKTNTKSTIHRPVYTDYIGVKRFNAKGEVVGEMRFIGLYTSAAYNRNPRDIPLLRRKVKQVMKDSHLSPTGHAGKALLNILETLPRDDLFQADSHELLDLAMGILHLQERKRIRLFVRKDVYGRFMSCLVYIPRDLYKTELRQAFQKVLKESFNGVEVTFTTLFTESVLARVHYMIRIDPTIPMDFDVKEIEAKLIEVGRTWQEDLITYLKEYNGEEKANYLFSKYGKGFPAGYMETINPRSAVFDLAHIEKLKDDDSLEMTLFKPLADAENTIRLKLYTLNRLMPLSDVLPILENMGLRVIGETPHIIGINDGGCAWVNEFTMVHEGAIDIDIDVVKNIFQDAVAKVWFGGAESDGFNKLVLSSKLSWQEITILRAYTKYFRQIGFTFSQLYIEEVLSTHPTIATQLVSLFELRFKPTNLSAEKLKEKTSELEQLIIDELEHVASLDEDRILRHFFEVINATLRTNYYQLDANGNPKDYLSLKLNPTKIPDLPLPRPMYEIFVYSPRVEGVHLRSLKVARGGLRWSDRREDFRTEILGLMKAQKVKNAVIVPAGAKGGFVAKCLPVGGSREEVMQEVVASYKTFIRGLLDVVDNLKDDKVIHPDNTVCYDEEDFYLVVAADKGTATFSDYANEVSKEYGFWLDDAFASGGETGYDHKKMGITAKGAWESVKRHFRELGKDIQSEDFTAVGIGDMAGDVFGNGMLLSRHIKLVAAFNHMHIFVDPDPDPEISFKERERLFNLPRSSWTDYNPKLLSKGAAIFERSAKSLTLTPEIMQALDIQKKIVVPNELIDAILRAKVDLLWNGGIGTYVKASFESHADVGDKANDALRINGNNLRCQVVGEGGNLGLTQLARVECSLAGRNCYTDFIDNSAGVDCSDHEVNIKILLNKVVDHGDLTLKQRNKLLADMTDDVSSLVLRNNYVQTRAINLISYHAQTNLDLYIRVMQDLEVNANLNRELEFLPDDKALKERKSKGLTLTRPEISVLSAYTKILLKDEILKSSIPEDPYISNIVETTFPKQLNKKFSKEVHAHSLRREIIATQLANDLVNNVGIAFVKRIHDETGASMESIVRAYCISKEVFQLELYLAKIEELDNKVSANTQNEMILTLSRLIRRATRWFLANYRNLDDVKNIIALYHSGVEKFFQDLPSLLYGAAQSYIERIANKYVHDNVPEETAQQISNTNAMFPVLDIIAAANEYKYKINDVAKVYFSLGAKLELAWFRASIIQQGVDNHWEAMAKATFRDDVDWQQRELTISVLKYNSDLSELDECVDKWAEQHKYLIDRWYRIVSDLRSTTPEFVMFAVAIRGLLDLTQASMQSVKEIKTVAA